MIKQIVKWLKRAHNTLPKVYKVDETYPCYSDSDIPFEILNSLQSCFRDHYDSIKHCVVESGTGTGKTALAYIASRCFLDEGQRVILTAPTRELVKGLYRDSTRIWGSQIVGLNTGNDKDVSEKYFIVTTPEGFLSAVRAQKEWVNAKLLIIDESHNILDPSRGGDLDVAITVHVHKGGKALLLSGTLPNKKELAAWLKADLFLSTYRKTKIHMHEIHAPDDINARAAPKSSMPEAAATITGYIYNRNSVRIRVLKDILQRHQEESVLVFVPTKITGFCLSESLVCPVHCADIADKEKQRIISEFNSGSLKTLLATSTLSQGVNTPADVVIVCGTRRGGYYLDHIEVQQMFGRAGRGKAEATVYLIANKIEMFNARKNNLAKSLPLPVESVVLTLLSSQNVTAEGLIDMLDRTYAATLSDDAKIRESVKRYLTLIDGFNLLNESNGVYSLTEEGALLARYYISPKKYIGYISAAKQLAGSDMNESEKGCVLISMILHLSGMHECPPKFEKDIKMKLIPLELDKVVSPAKAGILRYMICKPSAMPQYLPYQLKDVERWIGMLGDMEKYGIYKEAPGKAWLRSTTTALKYASVKVARKRPVQISLL